MSAANQKHAGGKGFRAKEILLDAVEAMKDTFPAVQEQLLEFSVVGPGATLVYERLTSPRPMKTAIARTEEGSQLDRESQVV